MVQPSPNIDFWKSPVATEKRATLGDTLTAVKRLQLYVDVGSELTAEGEWIGLADLTSPASTRLAELMRRFKSHGFAPNKKAASASLLLRIGWAGGFAIASYLACRRVPYVLDYAMHFGANTLLRGMWVRQAQFAGLPHDPLSGSLEWMESVSEDVLRARLLESLISFTEPILAGQHSWSRFSRHALWAMVTSSWAGQFASVARQLGDAEMGAREAQAMFALDSEIARAAPELYEVRGGQMVCTCQKRAACCLYFKSPGRNFCASCPIIPGEERLARNRDWVVAQRPSQ